MTEAPLDRLRRRIAATGAPLCVGVDPDPRALPPGLPADASGIERFAIALIRAAAPYAAAVKLNVAFFEALGSDGWRALERARAEVPAELYVILDAKRGDIGPTAERYAAGLIDHLGADAVTLSAYLGEDAIEPFLARPGRVVYLLARTSNPSAGRWQDAVVEGRPLHEAIARWAVDHWPEGRVGLVVGATDAGRLAALRRAVPEPGFLVPGVGAQRGDLDAALAACHGTRAPGVVNVSRGIAGAARDGDWEAELALAAEGVLQRMRAGAADPTAPGAGATLAGEHPA